MPWHTDTELCCELLASYALNTVVRILEIEDGSDKLASSDRDSISYLMHVSVLLCTRSACVYRNDIVYANVVAFENLRAKRR